ncbi:MAG: amidase [Oceanicoccus sp.]|jgi:amidase
MYLSAIELSNAIANREISCLELMQDTVNRIEALNPTYNAIVAMADVDELYKQAEVADIALGKGEYWGWMHGMPHAVKDLANLKGFINSFGSPLFKNNIATQDQIFVERIRRQGAIFVGKTNVPEFGLGSQSYNPVYGYTKNAFNPLLCAGGSSGGAAVALATGLLPVADGSDMMGSLRNPAAFNNIVGFRPSLGRIPASKNDLFFDQLATDGPMGRTVSDVIQLFNTMSGTDGRAPLSMRHAGDQSDMPIKHNLTETKVGWLGSYAGYLPMQDGVIAHCESALTKLNLAGAQLSDAKIVFSMDSLWECWLTLRHWLIANDKRNLYLDSANRRAMKPELVWEIESGLNISGTDLFNASIVRSDWYRTIHSAFQQWDILALPAAQVYPFPVDQHWPSSIANRDMDTYHRWMEVTIGGTLCGCPVISLPAGFDSLGRPMGIQFMANMGDDRKLFEFALAYEEVNPWHFHYRW